ncbi:cytosine permease [Sphingomonas zeicaulis]|uniref:purine-cytosine permease family protein n=1 Tax=Sphingomonas zeicaulis TaxID=1632740 RepID=UPI003D1CCFD1
MSGGEAAEQYAHAPVPEGVTISGWRVGLIVASFSIGVPDFFNGATNALALGMLPAIAVAVIAGLLLCVGGFLTSLVSIRSRLSTYLLTRRSFGIGGAAVINLVVAFIHFCWFGVNATFVGEALQTATRAIGLEIPLPALIVLGGALMTASTIFGFRALERLALIAVPVLALVLLTVVVTSVSAYGIETAPSASAAPMPFGIALSAVIGAYMLAVATMPDLSRFISRPGGGAAAMAISFPVAMPLTMAAAAVPALATGQTSLMALVPMLGLGTPTLFLLLLPTWTLNAANLYSASLSLGTTFPRLRQWLVIVAGGVIGTLLALGGILEAFVPFVLFLSVIIPPIAAIYVIDALTRFRGVDAAASIADLPAVRWRAMFVWLGAAAIATLGAHAGWTVTQVPALDATIAAALAYVLLQRRAKRDPGNGAEMG